MGEPDQSRSAPTGGLSERDRTADARRRVLAHTVRKVVTIVLVLNVALGMAFSVIGLRHQANTRAAGQASLLLRMNKINWIRAETWKSVAQGKPTPGLMQLNLSTFGQTDLGVDTSAGDRTSLDSDTAAFVSTVGQVRMLLNNGDVPTALTTAANLADEVTNLLTLLNRFSAEHKQSSDRANTLADVETVVLMLSPPVWV